MLLKFAGHRCVLKACTVEDGCLIGMGSVLEEGSYMEAHSMLAAGSVLPKGARVPTEELWRGNPAQFYRKLTHEELEMMDRSSDYYSFLSWCYKQDYVTPTSQAALQLEEIIEQQKSH